jgi:hypothetical protein
MRPAPQTAAGDLHCGPICHRSPMRCRAPLAKPTALVQCIDRSGDSRIFGAAARVLPPEQNGSRHSRSLTGIPCALASASVHQVWVQTSLPRKFDNADASVQALLDDRKLFGRHPSPPSLRTRQNRNGHYACSLTCQLMGTRSHARRWDGRRGPPDAYVLTSAAFFAAH